MNLVIDSVFVMLVCFVLGALIADILYAVVDPRIRYGGADR